MLGNVPGSLYTFSQVILSKESRVEAKRREVTHIRYCGNLQGAEGSREVPALRGLTGSSVPGVPDDCRGKDRSKKTVCSAVELLE